MSCCGQGRMALKTSQAGAAPMAGAGAAQPAGSAMARTPARMRYLGAAPIVVYGGITGAAYSFSAARPVQWVDARDVAGLLRKGVFGRSA